MDMMVLRTYMFKKSITRKQFADSIGVSISSAANKIHGRTPINISEAQKAHDDLKIPISIFLQD